MSLLEPQLTFQGKAAKASKLASLTTKELAIYNSNFDEFFLLRSSPANISSAEFNKFSLYQKRVQILQRKLKYKFKNILLLHEALTHSFDDDGNDNKAQMADSLVTFKKRTNYRLKTFGVSVLKMIACEYATGVCHEDKTTTEGTLTKLCQDLTNNEVLTKVGAHLNLKEFVEISQSCSKSFKIENAYPDLVRSIFASIFIDSTRGIKEHGVSSALVVFILTWKALKIFKEKSAFWERFGNRDLEDLFPVPPTTSVGDLLRKRFGSSPGYKIQDLDDLEKCLLHKFTKRHVLEQALTDDSVWNYREFKRVGHYQILEFIGDAIFELVICEYLYWHFVNDADGAYFNRKMIEQFTQCKFQTLMTLNYGIINFLRVPPSVKVKNMHDFMEAVIGALYVDTRRYNGITYVKEYLYNYCYRINCHAAVILEYELPFFIRKCHAYDSNVVGEELQCSNYHSVKIVNLNTFISNWRDFTVTEDQHLKNFKEAVQAEVRINAGLGDSGFQQLKEKAQKIGLPEYCCNQLESERVNVYRHAARIYLKIEKDESETSEMADCFKKSRVSLLFACTKYLFIVVIIAVLSYFAEAYLR